MNPWIISIISMENAPFNWQSEVNAFEERWQPHSRSLQMAVLPRKVNSPPTRWRQRPKSEQEKKHNETHSNASWIRRFCVPWFYVLRMFYVLFGCVSEETSLVRVEGRILGNVVRWAGTTWRILHSCLNHLQSWRESVTVARLKSSHSKFNFFNQFNQFITVQVIETKQKHNE